MKLPLTVACWDYDRTRALIDGRIAIEGCEATFFPLPVEETFFRALRHAEFDVAELSLSSYLMLTDRARRDAVANACRWSPRRHRRPPRAELLRRAAGPYRSALPGFSRRRTGLFRQDRDLSDHACRRHPAQPRRAASMAGLIRLQGLRASQAPCPAGTRRDCRAQDQLAVSLRRVRGDGG